MDLREQSYGKAGYQPSGAADDLFPGTFYLAEVRVCGSRGVAFRWKRAQAGKKFENVGCRTHVLFVPLDLAGIFRPVCGLFPAHAAAGF